MADAELTPKPRNADLPVRFASGAVMIAIAGIAVSFLELDDYPSQEEQLAMTKALADELGLTKKDAGELAVLGRWMMTQCNGPQQGIDRMARKLYKLSKGGAFAPLMTVIKTMTAASDTPLSPKQKSALEDIQTAFRIT